MSVMENPRKTEKRYHVLQVLSVLLDDKAKTWGMDVVMCKAREIADQLDYKSANSIRSELYELVDQKKVVMVSIPKAGLNGFECWFTLPKYAPVEMEI